MCSYMICQQNRDSISYLLILAQSFFPTHFSPHTLKDEAVWERLEARPLSGCKVSV